MDLRIHPTKAIFISTSTVFFPSFFNCHFVFQDQSEDCIVKDDITDKTEVFGLQFMRSQYVILCSKKFKEIHKTL